MNKTFAYSHKLASFVVPATGTYAISVAGAPGGGTYSDVTGQALPGALGGEVSGDFALVQGETLDIAVGGVGGSPPGPEPYTGAYESSGGGGGSFVVLINGTAQTLLAAAGGGAGDGFAGSGGVGGVGPSGDGLGGTANGSGSGAGFYGDGATEPFGVGAGVGTGNDTLATGGADFADGLAGGAPESYAHLSFFSMGSAGGFGGGGGGGAAGGGGGGYTGGDSGLGGTSFLAASALDPQMLAGSSTAALVTIHSLACFLEGTLIGTPTGLMPVETLAAGDAVLTAFGAVKLIRWVGHRRIDCANHPRPQAVWPIRVAAHALGPSQPAGDVFLSPDHAVFTGEALIPVRHLIDGAAIRQVRRAEVTYLHLELDTHEIILADGLPVESFLPAGDRSAFEGEDHATPREADFHSLAWEAHGCAPLVIAGRALHAARARIVTRASATAIN